MKKITKKYIKEFIDKYLDTLTYSEKEKVKYKLNNSLSKTYDKFGKKTNYKDEVIKFYVDVIELSGTQMVIGEL